MSEKILVPLDGSGLGEAALDYVNTLISRLSPTEHVTVVLLHVITSLTHQLDVTSGSDGAVFVPYTHEEMEKLQAESKAYLEHAAARLKGCGAEVETLVLSGNNHPAEEIVKAEEELGCDLVAMSTHGRSGFSRWAFGSVTDKVLRAGTVPVLMIRAAKRE